MEQLTLLSAAPLAKTSRWLADVRAWGASDPAFSGTSAVLLMRSLPRGFSGKTSLALSTATAAPISLPCCGASLVHSLTCPMADGAAQAIASARNVPQFGVCLTLNTSEWPSDAVVSSLSQVLETDVPSKYFLSPKACAGILSRADRRARSLPPLLQAVLEARSADGATENM